MGWRATDERVANGLEFLELLSSFAMLQNRRSLR
jgi:hypothetical protein